jgi:hypothetical protein
MTLFKSLFLGSAAGLVAISGASAADLAVTKPAPAEYVKVCSVGGMTGFTIPGSDVCLDIGGRVRMDVRFGDDAAGDFGYSFQTTAQLTLDARTDTSLGVLRSFIAFDMDDNDGLNETALDRAFIQLGGFTVGLATSVAGFDDFGLVGVPFNNGFNQISYTFVSDSGFYVSLAIEDPINDSVLDQEVQGAAAIGYEGGGVHVRLGGYANTLDAFGVILTAQASFGAGTTVLGIGQYEDLGAGDRWAVGLKLSQKFNDSFSASISGSYAETDVVGGTVDSFNVTAGFDYTVVPGFTVGPEVTYAETAGADAFSGRLRFQRNF